MDEYSEKMQVLADNLKNLQMKIMIKRTFINNLNSKCKINQTLINSE